MTLVAPRAAAWASSAARTGSWPGAGSPASPIRYSVTSTSAGDAGGTGTIARRAVWPDAHAPAATQIPASTPRRGPILVTLAPSAPRKWSRAAIVGAYIPAARASPIARQLYTLVLVLWRV